MHRNSIRTLLTAAVAGVLVATIAWIAGLETSDPDAPNAEAPLVSLPLTPVSTPRVELPPLPEPEPTALSVEVGRSAAPETKSEPTFAPRRIRKVFLSAWVSLRGEAIADATLNVVAAPPSTPWRPPERDAFFVPDENGPQVRDFAHCVAGNTDSWGHARLDISKFFEVEPGKEPRVLWVKVMGSMPPAKHFDLMLPPEILGAHTSGEREIYSEFEVSGSCSVRAVARCADGTSPVELCVLELRENSSAKYGAPLRTEPRLEFRLERGVEYVLVAFAPGYRPQARRFVAEHGLDLGEFVLDRGAALSGRLTLRGEPVEGRVLLKLSAQQNGFRVDGNFAWRGDQLEWAERRVSTDSEGRFRIDGLAPEAYELTFELLRGAVASNAGSARVRAPAEGLEFELQTDNARIELQVLRGGAPAPDFELQFHERSPDGAAAGGALRTDADGVGVLWIRPDRATSVSYEVRPDTQSPPLRRELTLDFPGGGQRSVVRIDL
jgi:hypothetical protein